MRLKINMMSFIFLSQPFSPTAMIKFVRRVTVINKLYIIEGKNLREGGRSGTEVQAHLTMKQRDRLWLNIRKNILRVK